MEGIYEYFRIIMAAAAAALTYFFGGADMLLMALISCIVIDYISGVIGAIIEKKLNSEVGFKGLLKKVGILLIVAAAHIVGNVVGIEEIRSVVIGFYIANEGISVLENLGKIGVPFPEKLMDVLEQLKGRGGKYGDK